VFVVDDDPGLRRAVRLLLRTAGWRVELFACAEDFLDRPAPDETACAILDVSLPGLSGLDVQQAVVERGAALPLIFLAGQADVPMAVRAMKAGAVDFLVKPASAQDLLGAVGRALAEAERARCAVAEQAELQRRAGSLSPREREVMALVAGGMLNKQVGQRLGVTEKTVKAHRCQVMRKMRAGSLAELVLLAERVAALPPDAVALRSAGRAE
jgi:FixJ family two-component response regulator